MGHVPKKLAARRFWAGIGGGDFASGMSGAEGCTLFLHSHGLADIGRCFQLRPYLQARKSRLKLADLAT